MLPSVSRQNDELCGYSVWNFRAKRVNQLRGSVAHFADSRTD